MVRLKGTELRKAIKAVKFQFHYGTIKREDTVPTGLHFLVFQFHYGTIKSLLLLEAALTEPRFNSTMVRLKE